MLKESAVVLLHEQSTDSLILTKRSAALREHPGEYCFPGGRKDQSDNDLWETATRELFEELGITADRLTLVKGLEPEYTLHGKIIYPWLVTIKSIQPYEINRSEVAHILSLSIPEVTSKNNYKNLYINHKGQTLKSCQYTGCQQFVWGATAKIMQQLCDETDLFQSPS